MSTLNKAASDAARELPVTACTDITGFGLLGHAFEVADRSGVRLQMSAGDIPLLPGAYDYAREGQIPGGLERNLRYFERTGVRLNIDIDPALAQLLFDPQTSGGLLFSIPADSADDLLAAFAERSLPIWCIGNVDAGTGIDVAP
jgi:selenide,water dikinase